MIYREVLTVPRTDLCEQVLNESKAHPVIRQFMELIKDGKKNKLQLCPYNVGIEYLFRLNYETFVSGSHLSQRYL